MGLFNLITDQSELKNMNDGATRSGYEQVAPTRDCTGDNFSNGQINFKWQCNGQNYWIPSKSYMRTRVKLTKGDGSPLDVAAGIAPNMDFTANLFTKAKFSINDKSICNIGEYLPQVDALEYRISKSSAWSDSIGNSSNWWQTSRDLRLAQVSSDGRVVKDTTAVTPADSVSPDTIIGYTTTTTVAYVAATGIITFGSGSLTNASFRVGDFIVLTAGTVGDGALNVKLEVLVVNANLTMTVRAGIAADIAANADIRFSRVRPNAIVAPPSRRINEFETVWTPPLSIFKLDNSLPVGNYELSLTPAARSDYARAAIETALGTNIGPGLTPNDVKLEIVDIYLYIYMFEGPRLNNMTYYLDLENTSVHTDKVNSSSFSQKNFEVAASTYALTAAYQDVRVGQNSSISTTKFKSYNVAGDTSQELKLNRFFINYGGVNYPQPDAEPSFQVGKDNTTQRYMENQFQIGAYDDASGGESIEEYHDRGAYYHFNIHRDGSDRSTRVIIHNQFDAADVANTNILLFEHSRSVCAVRIEDNQVYDITFQST